MMAALLVGPAVVIGAFSLLVVTSWLERVVGLRRSDRWPLAVDFDLIPAVTTIALTPPSQR